MNRRNLGYLIALAALLISIPRYIATFARIDPVGVTAWGMGILLAGGAAYIVDAWADASKRNIKRAWLLLIALGVNLLYEPILLTPFVLSRLWDVPLASAMSSGYAVFWSVMVTLAPVLLVFGVVYAVWFHKQPVGKSGGNADTKRATSKTNGQKADTEMVYPFACLVCSETFRSQAALNGHMNKHRSDNGREKQPLERKESEPQR